ncbi:MAG TPA: hypothetical protein VGD33_01855, partial [Chitinophagaceae bacterium]
QAKTMRSKFKESKGSILAAGVSKEILPQAELFDKQDVLDLLNQDDCTGLRVYYSMDEAQNFHLLLVGANSKGDDIIDSNDPQILDEGGRCPPTCPVLSELG